MRNTLIIEIDYSETLTVSTAHAMVGALADGEGVVQVRARLAPPDHSKNALFTSWDSAEFGTNP